MAKVCTIAGLLRSTPPPVLPSRSRPSSMRRPLVYKSRTPTNHPQIPAVLREVAGGCALGGPLCSQHRRCPTAVAAVRVLQAGGPPPLSCIESPYFWESFSQNCPGCLVFASTSFFFNWKTKYKAPVLTKSWRFPIGFACSILGRCALGAGKGPLAGHAMRPLCLRRRQGSFWTAMQCTPSSLVRCAKRFPGRTLGTKTVAKALIVLKNALSWGTRSVNFVPRGHK